MKDRIREIRKAKGLTQTAFGEKIGVRGNTITNYENGLRTPTDAVLLSICREFGVNELWLRTGEGEMFLKPTKNDQIAAMIADVLVGENEFKKKLIAALASFDESDWEKFEAVLDKVIQGMNEEKEE